MAPNRCKPDYSGRRRSLIPVTRSTWNPQRGAHPAPVFSDSASEVRTGRAEPSKGACSGGGRSATE